ncbi:ferrous iron transport protein B [Lacticaseibacillus kribbianus]|uniref:ferrous iron transport protein B n=1 Tax=Lacticaseibacillus kribbianus TaxID=2926292 RepID=UPI001CD782B3|nr:ferrous iron transport protein B [Lacticaseibacillus kribbianus]
MSETLALIGNPNSGKTTLFNALTGARLAVGNWPGVTVERKAGRLKAASDVTLQDLPGTYSLSPYSSEELVTRDFLLNGDPSKVINVVDATNLERNLYLTLQVMEAGRPLILALNMMDALKSMGRTINLKKLGYALGVPVIGISALNRTNLDALVATATARESGRYPYPEYDPRVESAIGMIEAQLTAVPAGERRFDAIRLFERDAAVQKAVALTPAQQADIEQTIRTAERLFADRADAIMVNARYDFIARVVAMSVVDTGDFVETASDRIDRFVTNRWFALPIFAAVMWAVYYLSIQTVGTLGSDWLNDTVFGRWLPGVATHWLTAWHVAAPLQSLLVDGLIGGLGAVLGFLPQIAMLFLCLGILEDCGYMARIAFVMDRVFHRFNLSGKAFIPMLIATGCGVPGIMATRTIESDRDRKMSIMLTTFMPCSAKLTVIALVAGTFFPGQSWVAPSAYFISVLAVVGSGVFLKKTRLFEGPPAPFVMELPAYHRPLLRNLGRSVGQRSLAFVHKAGTIIFLSCVGLWFLSNFNWRLQMVPQNASLLRDLGNLLAPVFSPLGFGDWRATVATVAGLIAKENCVGTLRIAFGPGNFAAQLRATYAPMGGFAFLVFNLLCAPCFASIGTMYKEFGQRKWTLMAIGYQTGIAYLLSVVVYQSARLVGGRIDGLGLAFLLVALAAIVYGLVLKRPRPVASEQLA